MREVAIDAIAGLLDDADSAHVLEQFLKRFKSRMLEAMDEAHPQVRIGHCSLSLICTAIAAAVPEALQRAACLNHPKKRTRRRAILGKGCELVQRLPARLVS